MPFSNLKYGHNVVQPISRFFFSSCKTKTYYHWTVLNAPSHLPPPGNHSSFYFLSSWIWFLQGLHISGIVQDLSLVSYSLMSSSLIHVISMSEFPSFIRLNKISLYVHTTGPCTMWRLGASTLCAVKNLCITYSWPSISKVSPLSAIPHLVI